MRSAAASFHHTENNHLRAGWLTRKSDGKRVYATMIGECLREPLPGFEEAAHAAKTIGLRADRPLVLCMSSGIDSEAMALAFIEAGVRFRVAIARYGPGALNEEDIAGARAFCEKTGIAYDLIDIDLEKFFDSSRHLEFAREYQCRSPQLAVHLQLMEEIGVRRGELPIFAGNPVELEFARWTPSPMLYLPTEPHLCYLRFLIKNDLPGVPFFFSYSPELIYSFWRTDQFKSELELVDRAYQEYLATGLHERQFISFYVGKVEKYRQAGFAVHAREQKLTGFEEAKRFFRSYFEARGAVSASVSQEPFDHFFRRPLVELNPYPQPTAQIVSPKFFPRPDLLSGWVKNE